MSCDHILCKNKHSGLIPVYLDDEGYERKVEICLDCLENDFEEFLSNTSDFTQLKEVLEWTHNIQNTILSSLKKKEGI